MLLLILVLIVGPIDCREEKAPLEFCAEDDDKHDVHSLIQRNVQIDSRSLHFHGGSSVDNASMNEIQHKRDKYVGPRAGEGTSPEVAGDLRKVIVQTVKHATPVNESQANVSKTKAFAKYRRVTKTINVTKQENVSARVPHTAIGILPHEKNVTTVILEVATPAEVITAHIIIFGPLLVAWIVFIHLGSQEKHESILLPLTLAATNVGVDMVNESLGVILESPAAVTAFQGLGMGLILLIWFVTMDTGCAKEVPRHCWWTWVLIAVVYSGYQLANHVAYDECSLSERTVFQNMCPVIAIIVEFVIMPAAMQPIKTFRSKLSLGCMVVGAVLFSIQTPKFSAPGVASGALLALTLVSARLMQRSFLGNADNLAPISALAGIDGFVLFVICFALSMSEILHFWNHMSGWTTDFSVMLMLGLSSVTSALGHVTALALLRKGSATTLLVYSNVNNFMDVLLGNLWFGDKVLVNPGATVGLGVSLLSGIWYSVEAVCLDTRTDANKDVGEATLFDESVADKVGGETPSRSRSL